MPPSVLTCHCTVGMGRAGGGGGEAGAAVDIDALGRWDSTQTVGAESTVSVAGVVVSVPRRVRKYILILIAVHGGRAAGDG